MIVKGYYIWIRKADGQFDTIFAPTTDFEKLRKYIDGFEDVEYVNHTGGEKKFYENEKEGLFRQMLELNNL